MKRNLQKLLLLAVLSLVLGMLPVTARAADTAFTPTDSSRIYIISQTEPDGLLLQTAQLLQRQFAADGRSMRLVWGEERWVKDGDIVLLLDCGIPGEGYVLEVSTVAKITASDCAGLLYGGNALQKRLRLENYASIAGFTAENAPDTRQRVVSLDCGRKYFTKNWICNLIREMSWMGYNTLELHFSDDSGFRMDFWDPDYYCEGYEPANDFTWLCGSNYTSWTLSDYKNDPDQGKFLTTAEIIEILNTAREYHIAVIPAFDSPSHLDYTTWMYEQNYKANPDYSFHSTYHGKTYHAKDIRGCINYTGTVGSNTPLRWPYYSAVNIVDPQSKAFIFELYSDIADFFKIYAGSSDFSIGADEVTLSSSYGIQWGFPDFVSYINELNDLLSSKGYTVRMYNDFLGSTTHKGATYDFAENIEILYWDSPCNPSAKGNTNHTQPVEYYVNQGRTLYNCIQTGTYYALRVTSSGSDARSKSNRQWVFYHANEEDIWDEWYPADISEKGDYPEDAPDVPEENLGGAYYLIWCDYASVSTESEMWNGVTDPKTGEFYSLRNRMWSNSTKMWDWDLNEDLTYEEFAALRDQFGVFPGYSACSEENPLPAATAITSAVPPEFTLSRQLSTVLQTLLYILTAIA
jgi:hypothetical protein